MKLERQPNIFVHHGIPSDEMIANVPRPFIYVIDDLINDIDPKKLANIFTRESHHQNFTVILLTQCLFHQKMRIPRTNCHFIFLLRAPNDQLSIRNLANQAFSHEKPLFYSIFSQATSKNFGYLMVTLHPAFPNELRLR